MLNPFPILFLALLGYTILRLTIAFVLLTLVRRQLKMVTSPLSFTRLLLIGLEVLVVGLLILGAFTQYAVLLGLGIVLYLARHRRDETVAIHDTLVLWLLAGGLITLFITGAGTPAVDLPL